MIDKNGTRITLIKQIRGKDFKQNTEQGFAI